MWWKRLLLLIIDIQAACILQVQYNNQLKGNRVQKGSSRSPLKKSQVNQRDRKNWMIILRIQRLSLSPDWGRSSLMEMIWLQNSQETFCTTIDDDYTPEARFENNTQKVQGQIGVLHENLLYEYWDMLEQEGPAQNWVSDMVSAQQLLLVTSQARLSSMWSPVLNRNDVPAFQYHNLHSCPSG